MPIPKALTLKPKSIEAFVKNAKTKGGPKYLIDKLIPSGSICLLSGQQKLTMKTFFSIQSAISVASGRRLGSFLPVTNPGNVLIIAEEGSQHAYAKRVEACLEGSNLSMEDVQGNLDIIFREMIKIDNEMFVSQLESLCKQKDYKLIVMDSLYRMMQGDENKQEDANKVLDTLMKISKLGVSVLVLHHLSGHGSDNQSADIDRQLRGSTLWSNGYDSHIALRRYDSKKSLINLTVRLREAEEWNGFVSWDIQSENDYPISATLNIRKGVEADAPSKTKNRTKSRVRIPI